MTEAVETASAPTNTETPVVSTTQTPVTETLTPSKETSSGAEVHVQPAPAESAAQVVPPETKEANVEPKSEPSLLSKEPPKAETKVEEQKVETKADEKKEVEEKPLPTYEWKVPEGLKPDDERLTAFNKIIGEFEGQPHDHESFQKLGQALIDFHNDSSKVIAEKVQEANIQSWENTKKIWRDEFMNDAKIGGNRQETTLKEATEFIRTFGGTPEEQMEFHKLMDDTGIGNHKAVIRILSNAMQAKAEGKPLPANRPVAAKKSTLQRWYGGK